MFIKGIKRYVMLVLGLMILAYSVTTILRPNGLMTGGITGISRIIETTLQIGINPDYLFNIAYYTLALIVLLLAFIFLGKEDGMKIIFMSFVYPLFLFLFTFLDLKPFIIEIPIQGGVGYIEDLFIPAITYGFFAGIGTGIIMKSGYTSGGSDTIAKIIYKRLLPFLSIGQILMFIDGFIIFSSIFFFDIRITAFAFITKFVYIKSIDMIVFGIGNRRVKMEIISNRYEEISQFIMTTVNRGVTLIETEGGFTHKMTKQIVTICNPRESLMIKTFIGSIDANAFVYIIPTSSIWGQGFRNILKDDLSND